MSFGGGEQGYRGIAVRCPGCGEPMTIVPLEASEVDVCGACGGVWIDWFDGELRSVTRQIAEGRATGRIDARPSEPGSVRNETTSFGACPRCTRTLVAERYVLPATKEKPAAATGAQLMRCEDCMGAFVSQESAGVLVMLPPDEGAPPSKSDGDKPLAPLPWQRVMTALRRLLG